MNEEIAIVDFGSIHTQLIAKKIRSLGVFCCIYTHDNLPKLTNSKTYIRGIILSSGNHNIYNDDSPKFNFNDYKNTPILGICYGAQLIAKEYGGKIQTLDKNLTKPKFSKTEVYLYEDEEFDDINIDTLLQHINDFPFSVNISNYQNVISFSESYSLAYTNDLNNAIFKINGKNIYGLQFHPEMNDCEYGNTILHNFCVTCNINFDWQPEKIMTSISENMRHKIFSKELIKKEKLRNDQEYIPRVAMAISGGIKSTIASYLLQMIVGRYNFYPILIDNGFMRQGEVEDVVKMYKSLGFQNIRVVDGKHKFMKKLKNVTDPEEKRVKSGKLFVKLFYDEIINLEKSIRKTIKIKRYRRHKRLIQFVAQGTVYSDCMTFTYSDQHFRNESSIYKYYHNVGKLNTKLNVTVLEPFKLLFKSDLVAMGKCFGIPDSILNRQHFPAPGLSIRILGPVNEEDINILRDIDYLTTEYLTKFGYYQTCWQVSVVMLPSIILEKTYKDVTYVKKTFVIRAINSVNGINATIHDIPIEVLEGLSNYLCDKNLHVGRVVYDITPKPPANIEWN
jgi:GMP synthase (glutamine-hydrolysing)